MDALLAGLLTRLRQLMRGGQRGPLLIVLALIAIWLGSGFYRVQPDEMGVVSRFGAFSRTTQSGLNYHLPWPVETVLLPQVTHINRIEIGFRSTAADGVVQTGRDRAGRDVLEESLMLTGDENIIDIDFVVLWKIRDPVAFLFNVRTPPGDPSAVIRAVAESAMREQLGKTPIQSALKQRAEIEAAVQAATQTIVDSYGAGIDITQVQLQKVDPPTAVIDSFLDQQRASSEADTARNKAEAYRNDIVPRARGEAAQLTAQADADRQASIAAATGQTQRFLEVLNAYRAAKDVTLTRMYLETMESVMSHSPSVIVDGNLKGLVPFLSLSPPVKGAAAPGAGQ
jgi:membrane protease subunit HflK